MSGIDGIKYEKGYEYQNDLQKSFIEKISDNTNTNSSFLSDTAATLSISALGSDEFERIRQSWNNHPVSALYREDISISKNSNGVYRIGSVDFSEEDFTAARDLITRVGSQLKNGYLSYRDYAKMEMAEKAVDKCASEGFSEEQAGVISRAIRDFNNSLIQKQQEILKNEDTRSNADPSSGKYFGVQVSISQEARDLYNMSPGLKYGNTDIATNQELIDTIRDGIRAVNISDRSGPDMVRQLYQRIMRPVYSSQYPFQSSSNVNAALTRDVEGLMELFALAEKWQR